MLHNPLRELNISLTFFVQSNFTTIDPQLIDFQFTSITLDTLQLSVTTNKQKTYKQAWDMRCTRLDDLIKPYKKTMHRLQKCKSKNSMPTSLYKKKRWLLLEGHKIKKGPVEYNKQWKESKTHTQQIIKHI